MGMSSAEFEAQTKVGRFRMLYVDDAVKAEVPGAECYSSDELVCLLVEFEGDKPVRIVGSDGGCPEDQCMTRDWQWVAIELNKQALKLTELTEAAHGIIPWINPTLSVARDAKHRLEVALAALENKKK